MTYPAKYRTAPVPTEAMPPGIPYIVGNEAAERFSFYGMRTILTVFMVHYLWLMGSSPETPMSDAAAQERFHNFVSAAYFFPILGALISDAFLGKYRTIVFLSMAYCMGHGLLALMGTVWNAPALLFCGLALISIGSGGIKPCVSSHVGDQFGKTNARLLTRVFNYFYFAINFGALISTLLTPWLLKWFGPHWAFGVPGVLMAIATFIFWMGRRKFIHIPPGGISFLKEVLSLEGLRALLKLSILYAFIAVFWALFDQTGSSWVLQAQDMDRHWLGIEWLPSQVQAINPVMILTFIPIFTFVIYPAVDRVFPLTPIRKIAIGLFLMVGGFGIVALVQEWIDAGQRPSIAWHVLAYAILTASEVMVSIVGLEFSYTQAPRAMKSFVMALFLMSVSLGNFFTAGVNHFIQVPDTLASIDARAAKAGLPEFIDPGIDSEPGTGDEIIARYQDGKRVALEFPALASLEDAADRIESYVREHDWRLPSLETASGLLRGIEDPWRQPVQYTLVNSLQCRLTSPGPDREIMTPWDQGLVLDLELPPAEKAEQGFFGRVAATLTPAEPWLATKRKGLGLDPDTPQEEAIATIVRSPFIGGQTRLQGASYFWFFTDVMLGTAIAFLVVAKFYKPKEYLHEEESGSMFHEDIDAVGKP